MRGTIRAAFYEPGAACLAVAVTEANGEIIEYLGRVLLTEPLGARSSDGVYIPWNSLTADEKQAAPNRGQSVVWAALTSTQQRQTLLAAVKASRDKQMALRPMAPAFSGIVTI